MGLRDRLRRKAETVSGLAPGTAGREVGPTLDDVAAVRRAILREADRRGRDSGLSLTLLMEHALDHEDLDYRRIDLHAVLGHLAASGDLVNVEQDSFGNLRFDVAPRLRERSP